MPLLLDEDYAELAARGLNYCEDEAQRVLVFQDLQLPEGLYQQASCDVLVEIPRRYNQDGNDMLWTYPRVTRADGKAIPATNNSGTSDNRSFQDREYCRWSRHWNQGPSVWKPGTDGIVTIMRRIEWALGNPDAQ